MENNIKGCEKKLEIIKYWLGDHDFDLNSIKITSDRSFVSAQGRQNNLVIAIVNDGIDIDQDQLMITAYKNQAQAWIANVNIENTDIDWEYL